MGELNNSVLTINERLAYVDFKLQFTGHISRADLKSTFGIAEAAASRVLTEYSKLRSKNKMQKTNTILRDTFKPLLSIDGETALGMLANGFNGNKLNGKTELVYEKIGAPTNPLNVEDVAKITRAISSKYSIKCNYLSENSSKHGTRTLVPHAIMYDGTNWMFRAYDRSSGEADKFKNFHFRRAFKVAEEFQEKEMRQHDFEAPSQDKLWNLRVPMFLRLKNVSEKLQEKIRVDFGMEAGTDELILTERAAFRWILQKKFYIDARSEAEKAINQKDGINRFYKFELTNLDMITQLENN